MTKKSDESEERVTVNGIVVSPQDGVDFLSEIGSEHVPCPICTEDDWLLSIGPGGGAYTIVPTATGVPGKLPAHYMPVFSTECRKCGYTRFHNLIRLAKWVKARTESKDEP